MTSKLLSILLLFILTLFISCNRSDDEPPVQRIPKIKQMIFFENYAFKEYKNFEYDRDGRLLKITGDKGYSETYTYLPGKVTRKVKYTDQAEPAVTTFDVNYRGLAISRAGYAYDELGYLTWWNTQSEFRYTVSRGNTVAMELWVDNQGHAQLSYSYHYTFLTDKINTIGNENKGITFFGKQDKNLVSREIYNDPIRGIELTFDHVYEFDAKNRVSKSQSTYWPGRYIKYVYND